MSDDPNKLGEDRKRINIQKAHDVQYWSKKINVSKDRLIEAVKSAGFMADDVERESRGDTGS
jgi:hypothetical protein